MWNRRDRKMLVHSSYYVLHTCTCILYRHHIHGQSLIRSQCSLHSRQPRLHTSLWYASTLAHLQYSKCTVINDTITQIHIHVPPSVLEFAATPARQRPFLCLTGSKENSLHYCNMSFSKISTCTTCYTHHQPKSHTSIRLGVSSNSCPTTTIHSLDRLYREQFTHTSSSIYMLPTPTYAIRTSVSLDRLRVGSHICSTTMRSLDMFAYIQIEIQITLQCPVF